MKIRKTYEIEDAIPSEVRDFYEERDGAWHLTLEVEGSASQDDVTRLNGALTKERNDHRATKEKLRAFGDLDPARAREIVDRVSELGDWDEVQGKLHRLDDTNGDQGAAAIEQRVQKEIERRESAIKAPLEREIKQLRERAEGAERERDETQGTLRGRTIADEVRAAAARAKVIDSALDDVLLYGDRIFEIAEDGTVQTKDGVGVTPGLKPEAWLSDMKERRPHWWPTSQGAGSQGNRGGTGGGSNPFSAEGWNMTEQGRLFREDPAKAERLAKAAGTTVGGPRPPARTRAA
ncbi:hypothetical protein [Methylobacterium sp. JK268]